MFGPEILTSAGSWYPPNGTDDNTRSKRMRGKLLEFCKFHGFKSSKFRNEMELAAAQNRGNGEKDGKVKKTLRLNSITAAISDHDHAGHYPKNRQK